MSERISADIFDYAILFEIGQMPQKVLQMILFASSDACPPIPRYRVL
jgi:hypothetical protein